MKANPLYKGVWTAPFVENPAYKGPWSPRRIPNPNYFEDLHPADFNKIGAVGFEIWSMTEDILFDNIYIGHSPEDAKTLAAESFHVKHAIEKAQKEAKDAKKKEEQEDKASKGASLIETLARFKEDPAEFVREQVLSFLEEVQEDGPVVAFKANPQVGGAILASLLTLFGAIAALFGLVGSSAQPVVKSTKKTDAPTPDAPKVKSNDVPTVVAGEPAAAADSNLRKRAAK